MKKKIGVTGASGFLGNVLVKKLIAEGYEVVVLSRSKKEFSAEVTVVTGDLLQPKSIDNFLKSVDTVIHLAARQLPPEELFFRDNVSATNNLIERMLHFPIKHLIYLSTVVVYGEEGKKIHTEKDICLPTTVYAVTKYLSEIICQYWESKTKKILTILRPFNIYGKGNKKGVIYHMVKNIRQNKPIIIYGDGKQKRDFLYVDDVVEAILLAIKKEKKGIFNLGSGENLSLVELVSLINNICSQKVQVEYKNIEQEKVTSIAYTVGKAQTLLGWKPKVNIQEGLKELL